MRATKLVVLARRAAMLATPIVVSALVASTAHTQPLITSRPPVTWIGLARPGDSSGSAGHVDRMGELALEPLRLSLLGEFVPHPSIEPGCSDNPEAIGGATGAASGMPFQRLLATNLLGAPRSWRAPRLTLFGFSRGGCAMDAAAGGGMTLTLPIRQDIFFVASGGAIYLPHGGPGGRAARSVQARGDIVFQRSGGRSYTLGLGMSTGGPRVSFGGVF